MRKALRNRRKAIPPSAQARAAVALVDSVIELPQWSTAQRIALYSAFDGEIDTGPLALRARDSGKTVYLPIVTESSSLVFAQWDDRTALDENHFGILQPREGAPRHAPGDMDIVFAPLVGWDASGNRLGMGGGYYDRALGGQHTLLKVGLAHTCQQVSALETSAWDIAMDYIATDTALHCCREPVAT